MDKKYKIFITKLPHNTRESTLDRKFSKFGPILSIKLIVQRNYAFIVSIFLFKYNLKHFTNKKGIQNKRRMLKGNR